MQIKHFGSHLTSAQLLTGCSYSSIAESYEFTPDAKS